MAKVFRPEEAHPQFRLCESHMRVLRYIAWNPGCPKYHAAKAGTYSSMRNPTRQYYLVNTLIRHGYICATNHGNRYQLGLPVPIIFWFHDLPCRTPEYLEGRFGSRPKRLLSLIGEESNHIAGLTTDVI